jgi:phosphopantetheinyl transferase (holo-ACP synthase)
MTIIGIGNDIIKKSRLLSKSNIDKKFLTNDELKYLKNIKSEEQKADFISGR